MTYKEPIEILVKYHHNKKRFISANISSEIVFSIDSYFTNSLLIINSLLVLIIIN